MRSRTGGIGRNARKAGAAFPLVAALLAMGTLQAAATPLVAASYDTKNGDVSSIGTSLRDDTYAGGTGNPAVAYANLSGGRGDLTDGTIASGNWNVTPLPFVGWRDSVLPSPTLTFHFGDAVHLDQVQIHMNKGYSPSSVDFQMGGVSRNVVVDMGVTGGANDWVVFPGLDLTGDSLFVRLNDRPAEIIGGNFLSRDWILVGEFGFEGTVVPEPGTGLLMGIGLLAAAGFSRRHES